jgi:hypothetical protein
MAVSTTNVPDIYMISISDNPVSQMYKERVMGSWIKNGYHVNHFEAVTPKDLPNQSGINFSGHKVYNSGRTRVMTPTEMACFYSHYNLWKKVAQEDRPLIIIEHDSLLTRFLPSDIIESRYLSFVDNQRPTRKPTENDPGDGEGRFLAPGSGYAMFPDTAKELVKYCNIHSIGSNSDGILRTAIDWRKYPNYFYIKQVFIDNLVTIDHGTRTSRFNKVVT